MENIEQKVITHETKINDLLNDTKELKQEMKDVKSNLTKLMVYGAIGAFILTAIGGTIATSMTNKLMQLPQVQSK